MASRIKQSNKQSRQGGFHTEKFREQKYKNHRYLLIKALTSGLLVKPKRCSLCKRELARLNAHHNDYCKSLEVEWLCNRCHIRKHHGMVWNDDSYIRKHTHKRDKDYVATVHIDGKQHNLPKLKKDPCLLAGLLLEDSLIDHRQDDETIDTAKLQNLIKELPFREREIIKLRYGIGDGYTYTLEEVGRIFKVTRERARQVETRALRRLKRRAKSYAEFI